METKHRVAIVITYFGKWPEWIDLFFHSCKLNPSIHFFLYTDCETRDKYANNIHFFKTTFSDYKLLVSKKLGISFNPDQPYKLCDIKPFYGFLHQDILKDFDFYGFGDLDLVYGNIREFITNELLDKFDVISTHHDRISGHFALFKNTHSNINSPFKIKKWQEKLENKRRVSVDERYLALVYMPFLVIPLLVKKALRKILGREKVIAINMLIITAFKKSKFYKRKRLFFKEMYTTPFTYIPWLDGSLHEKQPNEWYYKNGALTNSNDGNRRFIYLHFMNFKSNQFRKDKLQLWNSKFYNIKADEINNGVVINAKGIFPLHNKTQ